MGWGWEGGAKRGSKRNGARGEVSCRTAQHSSRAVIVSQVMERKRGGGAWGVVADKGKTRLSSRLRLLPLRCVAVAINSETHM